MKKLILILICGLSSLAFARGPHHGYHGHRHDSWWGRGGINFIPGFVGGVVGGAVVSGYCSPTYVYPAGTVVAPVVAPSVNRVWIEGRWVNPTLPNGTTIRVWQPGYWEYY